MRVRGRARSHERNANRGGPVFSVKNVKFINVRVPEELTGDRGVKPGDGHTI